MRTTARARRRAARSPRRHARRRSPPSSNVTGRSPAKAASRTSRDRRNSCAGRRIRSWIGAPIERWIVCSGGVCPAPGGCSRVREGVLREFMEWRRIAAAGWRVLAIGYAVVVTCFTVLPSRVNSRLFLIDINELVNPRLVGRLALVGAVVAALMLAVSVWRHRRVWTARLSWPLLGWLALCLIGLAALVLISQPPSSSGASWSRAGCLDPKGFRRPSQPVLCWVCRRRCARLARSGEPAGARGGVDGVRLSPRGRAGIRADAHLPAQGPRLQWRGHSAGIVLGVFVRCPLWREPD